MIVDPDFLTHWRTRMLVDALGGDEMAPLYLLRIWGHCQARRSDRFEKMPAAGLKALCQAPCDAEALERALIDSGFVAREGTTITVPKWAEKNASLLAAWANGNKGGRPTKKPKDNPRVPDDDPKENPEETPGFDDETHGKPNENPTRTQTKPIRVDRSSVPKGTDAGASDDPDPIFGTGLAFLMGKGVHEKGARSFLGGMRKALKNDLLVIELLVKAQAEDISDPIPWLRAVAQKRTPASATAGVAL